MNDVAFLPTMFVSFVMLCRRSMQNRVELLHLICTVLVTCLDSENTDAVQYLGFLCMAFCRRAPVLCLSLRAIDVPSLSVVAYRIRRSKSRSPLSPQL